MTGQDHTKAVGELPNEGPDPGWIPPTLTRLAWALFVASLGLLSARLLSPGAWTWSGVVLIDGLTALLWVVVGFFSGIVHSYSRRYIAGEIHQNRFVARLFGFTVAVMVLLAADHVALFVGAWLAMGLVMADLIGCVEGWPQAQAAKRLARRYFLASSALLAAALAALAWETGTTTISGIGAAVGSLSTPVWLVAAVALLLAAMIKSALLPFQTWLLSSMTAPTPASALMHAGFVNAGGILLVRFAPVVTAEGWFMLLIAVAGAASALGGKLLKTVQTDVKGQLGCSTVGQMGFMIMQAGLGFFGAAITHLILHGFYKAYQFLSAGSRVEHASPTSGHGSASSGVAGAVVTGLTAVAGGAVFVAVTGKGTAANGGLLLAGLVVLTTMHAAREAVAHDDLPVAARLGGVPLVFLPAIAAYGLAYRAVVGLLSGLPVVTAPVELTVVHGLLGAAYLLAYLAIETGVYRHSRRLYVTLLNASQPESSTLLTTTEEYNEY